MGCGPKKKERRRVPQHGFGGGNEESASGLVALYPRPKPATTQPSLHRHVLAVWCELISTLVAAAVEPPSTGTQQIPW